MFCHGWWNPSCVWCHKNKQWKGEKLDENITEYLEQKLMWFVSLWCRIKIMKTFDELLQDKTCSGCIKLKS